MTRYKYWVSDLSEAAQTALKSHCQNKLLNDGYELSIVNEYIAEIENEKLGSLNALINNDMMIELSNMQ